MVEAPIDSAQAQARQFLEHLFPRVDGNNFIEIRGIEFRGDKSIVRADGCLDDIDEAAEAALLVSDESLHAYFGVAARRRCETGTRDNLAYTNAVWADVDVGKAHTTRKLH